MKLVRSKHHSPSCSGCPCCREDYARMLSETPEEAHRRMTAEDRARGSGRAAESAWRAAFASMLPPESYGPALATLRAASATADTTFRERHAEERRQEFAAEYARTPSPATPAPRLTNLAAFEPPNSYSLALTRLKETT